MEARRLKSRWRQQCGRCASHFTGHGDPLGTEGLTTHGVPPKLAPHGHKIVRKKQDGCIDVVLEH